MIYISLWQLALIVVAVYGLVKAVRKVQIFWLRKTNAARFLRSLRKRADADVRRGMIDPQLFCGICRLIRHMYEVDVVGWQRNDEYSYDEDVPLLLTGMLLDVHDVVGEKYDAATARSVQRWLNAQLV